jgi:transposase
MRRPAQLSPWLEEIELLSWLREAETADEHRKRMCVWLTHLGRFQAHEVAEIIGVSLPSVWRWVGQYNRQGPTALGRSRRGGRRWGYMSEDAERSLLASFAKRALAGDVTTAKQLHMDISRKLGQKVSLAYVYKLLHRNHWRKLGPRPRHVKADRNIQEAFKKTSSGSLPKR